MITPPPSWSCITRLAAWLTCSADKRLRAITFSLKRAEAVAASATGDPPALLTTTSRRPWSATIPSTRPITASVWRTSAVRTSTDSAPSAGGLRPHTTTDAPASVST